MSNLNLDDLVKGMLTDVRSGKANAKKAKKKPAFARPKHESVNNPWIDESITLLINTYTCDCGAEHSFPNPHMFIERTRLRHGHPEQHMEKTSLTNVHNIYAQLPRRTEHRSHRVHNCQRCFTPDANQYAHAQMAFNFNPITLH